MCIVCEREMGGGGGGGTLIRKNKLWQRLWHTISKSARTGVTHDVGTTRAVLLSARGGVGLCCIAHERRAGYVYSGEFCLRLVVCGSSRFTRDGVILHAGLVVCSFQIVGTLFDFSIHLSAEDSALFDRALRCGAV